LSTITVEGYGAYAPAMATVILARHGRTAANASGVLAGRTKGVHLDDTGTAQSQAAAERLVGLDLAAVVTSPLERCRETARILAPGGRAISDRRLLECDYGDWTGQELKRLAKEKLWRTVQTQPSGARFPGGESLPEMSARAVAAIRDRDATVEAENGENAVWLAVSHGDVLKAILADALGVHLDAFQRIVVDPASLSVVRYTPHRVFVLTMNSTSGSLAHLAVKPTSRRRTRKGDAEIGGGAGPETP
jgi:2,3-bisphosphoglycerate-dependent phosphoglycerate mutase